jgi:hypothetical protein
MLVEFIDLVRPDKRFASVGELVAQMKQDCRSALTLLAATKAEDPVTDFPLGKLQALGKI